MKRVVIPEWLDSDAGTPQEIADSLLDLRGINQKFGGLSTLRMMMERIVAVSGLAQLSVLEVAAGSGYVPNTVAERMQRRGISLKITLLDRALSHLPPNKSGSVAGDALSLPFKDDTFDLIDCNLFAHHLSPDELVKFVNEGLRVCRVAVLINDIVRNRLHLGAVYAARPLFRTRITKHDAVVSVRRAYTVAEMNDLLKRTRAARIEIHRHYLFRMGALAWK